MIRVPPAIIDSYKLISFISPKFHSFQGYVRAAIPYLLNMEINASFSRLLIIGDFKKAKNGIAEEDEKSAIEEYEEWCEWENNNKK